MPYMHTTKIAGGGAVKIFLACPAKFSKRPLKGAKIPEKNPKKSAKIAQKRRFSVIFTLKPKKLRAYVWVWPYFDPLTIILTQKRGYLN